jgi:hypothetical protein
MTETLRLDLIRLDGGTQPRAEISEELVDEYKNEMMRGAEFPPVIVFYDGTDHWLADGFHRVHARKRSSFGDVPADIRQGTKRDAILHSVGANATHGLRRTNLDKRRAVHTLLHDPEWTAWSDREIAKRCGVSQPFVTAQRKLQPATPSDNDYQIAQPRKVERGGRVYEMSTSSINAARQRPEPKPTPEPVDEIEPEAAEEAVDDVGETIAVIREFFASTSQDITAYKTRSDLVNFTSSLNEADPEELMKLIRKAERLSKWTGWLIEGMKLAYRLNPRVR